jgi:flagella basal body P-ring formation protein FlgA
VPVTFAIDVTEPVWVATEKIQGRSLLESSRLEKQSRNIAATNGAFVRSEQEMDGMRLRRTIHPGEILTLALLEPMPDVVKGATVTVIAKVGGITISQGAIAREDGLLAQKVEVENVGNNNRYVARVIGKNTLLAQ